MKEGPAIWGPRSAASLVSLVGLCTQCPAAPQPHPVHPDRAIFSLFLKREEPTDAPNSDALSTSSGLLDLLLHEDLCSATGSALSGSGASDSLGSSSLGCDTSGSGAGTLVTWEHPSPAGVDVF